jgi:hypothetical protein
MAQNHFGICAMSDISKENKKRAARNRDATAPAGQTDAAAAPTAETEAASASALLALAVTSAETSAAAPATGTKSEPAGEAPTAEMKPEPAATAPVRPEAARNYPWRGYGLQAAGLAIAIALGWLAGSQAYSAKQPEGAPAWAEQVGSGIRQHQDDITRLTGDVRALKTTVEALKDGTDQVRAQAAGVQRPLVERLDRIERLAQDATSKATRVIEISERVERADKENAGRLVQMTERLDKVEKQMVALATPPKPSTVAADAPAQTGSVPQQVEAKEGPLEGWVIRAVYQGLALIESRNGRMFEVARGQSVPGLGRVEAIERRGKNWVVVTSKGVISAERWL